jgi:hypothetical protein
MKRTLNDILSLIALIALFVVMLGILTWPIATAVEAIWFPRPAPTSSTPACQNDCQGGQPHE